MDEPYFSRKSPLDSLCELPLRNAKWKKIVMAMIHGIGNEGNKTKYARMRPDKIRLRYISYWEFTVRHKGEGLLVEDSISPYVSEGAST